MVGNGKIGNRILSSPPSATSIESPSIGTIRYVGVLDGDVSKQTWLGVEWDDMPCSNNSSNNDDSINTLTVNTKCNGGIFQGKEYFKCYSDKSKTSFMKLSKVQSSQFGTDFMSAVRERYCQNVSDEEQMSLCVTDCVTGRTKPMEFVGLRKAENYFKDFSSLESITLGGQYVSKAGANTVNVPTNNTTSSVTSESQNINGFNLGSRNTSKSPLVEGDDTHETVKPLFPRVRYLSLERCLFSDFNEVLQILTDLPQLQVLHLSNNLFHRSNPKGAWEGLKNPSHKTSTSPPSSLEHLVLENTRVTWLDLKLLLEVYFPNLMVLDISSNPSLFPPVSRLPSKIVFDQMSQDVEKFDLSSNNVEPSYVGNRNNVKVTSLHTKHADENNNNDNNNSKSESLVFENEQSNAQSSSTTTSFNSMKELEKLLICNNGITQWSSVISCINKFPALKSINVSNNYLLNDSLQKVGDDIFDKTSSPSRHKLPVCSSIIELSIENLNINEWTTMSILCDIFINLSSLRWQGNPLQSQSPPSIICNKSNKDSSNNRYNNNNDNNKCHVHNEENHSVETEVDASPLSPEDSRDINASPRRSSQRILPFSGISRQVVISLFPHLNHLNGGRVTTKERVNAERYFLSLHSRGHPAALSADPSFKHKNRLESIHSLGITNSDNSTMIPDRSRKQQFVDVILEPDCSVAYGKSPVKKSVPQWLKVGDLKILCGRLFDLPSSRLKLFYTDGRMPLCISLDDDMFDLGYYGMIRNDGIGEGSGEEKEVYRIRIQDIEDNDDDELTRRK